MFLLWKAISFRVVEGLIMPLQRSDVPEGILLKLNNNNKSGRQDRECDFFCIFLCFAWSAGNGEADLCLNITFFFFFSFFWSGVRYFYLQ